MRDGEYNQIHHLLLTTLVEQNVIEFDPDGKVALGGYVPSSFANIVETVEITGTLKTTSTAKLTGVQLLGGLDLNSQDITGTGNISTTGNLTLTSTDTGSSAIPTIDLVRDSSSPVDADYLGQIKFTGEDDGGNSHTYAKITGKIGDASVGAEDGLVEFAVVNGGSNDIIARLKTDGILLNTGKILRFEGATVNTNETTLTVIDLTADRTISLPDASGTIALTSDITASGISNVVEDTTFDSVGWNVDTNSNNITFSDNVKAVFGTGSDLQVFHNNGNSVIREDNSQPLYIQTDNTAHGVIISKDNERS